MHFDDYATYKWNGRAFVEDDGDAESKCPQCGGDLSDLFPEGPANFDIRDVPATKYKCPDCGDVFESRAIRVRCRKCKSLNLERQLVGGEYGGQWLKADCARPEQDLTKEEKQTVIAMIHA
jgi:predicted RNA-binding Zn-ribbon protein involved in translation (DUF1610 family)